MEQGKAEIGERQKERVRRMNGQAGAKAAH